MDSKMQEILDRYAELHTPPIETLTPQVARELPELRDAVMAVFSNHVTTRLLTGPVEHVHEVKHVVMEGPGGPLLIRLYYPHDKGPHPVLLYFHGGGFVLFNVNTYDSSCRALANAAQCVVASVAYRQAPEHKSPCAHDDAFAAYQWILRNATHLNCDPTRIAVGGESVGGNLAASICHQARREGFKQPVHQLLVYPMLDSNMETESYIEHADAKPLNKAMMGWFLKHYLNSSDDRLNPRLFPLLSESFTDLAPATIITAEIDPLCCDGETYSRKLQSFSVPVYYRCFEGVAHEFFGMGALVPAAKEAVRDAGEQLKKAFQVDDHLGLGYRTQPVTEEFVTGFGW